MLFHRSRKPAFLQNMLDMRKRLKGAPLAGQVSIVVTDIEGFSGGLVAVPGAGVSRPRRRACMESAFACTHVCMHGGVCGQVSIVVTDIEGFSGGLVAVPGALPPSWQAGADGAGVGC